MGGGPAAAGAPPSPPSPREKGRPPNPSTRPEREVATLQSRIPPATTTRREPRSPTTPAGGGASEKPSPYAEPSQPRRPSEKPRSRLTGSKSAKIAFRSR